MIYVGNILSTVGLFSTVKGYHEYLLVPEEYLEYHGG